MNNTSVRFSEIPNVEKSRSRMDRSSSHKTTFNTGDLIPVYIDEVLPGDTVTMDYSHVTRMTTPLTPVMDNAFLDVMAFFVPSRLVWNHWKAFWGENEVTYWEQPTEYEIPQIEAPTGGWNEGSLMDYMGIPIGVDNISVNHLPIRAYCKIVNDWWRDENLKDPCDFNTDETTLTGVNKGVNYDYVTDTQLGAAPFKVAKFHDYFTSALIEPQKGPDVNIPLGTKAPIIGLNDKYFDGPTSSAYDTNFKDRHIAAGKNTSNEYYISGINEDSTNMIGLSQEKLVALYADLNNATAATINQLRQAFAVQRFYEAQARGGSRYTEFIKNIFGVTSPDARQQRSEFLGAKRFPINVDQVLQTSETGTTPQGTTGAYSCTINADNLLTYSATEHGYLMVVQVIRTNHSYQQGIEKLWNKKKWTDFYVPQFANLGEMPIYNKEIYAQGTSADEEVFGYQEAWAEYRYKPNRISGKLRSTATNSLDIWHYGDEYEAQPYLSGTWIDETETNIARSLAVQNEPQFIADIYFKTTWTRVMPMYSIPGLLDHN